MTNGKTSWELWRLLRPRHWVKNGFVFLGFMFANAWNEAGKLQLVLLAFGAFCLVASGVYIFNDLFDREQDRNHPLKKQRPLAAKTVSTQAAIVLMIVVWILGFGLSLIAGKAVGVILLFYIALNVAYSFRLKDIVLLDVFTIAAGFMLRILAGTMGIGIPPTQWILLCGLMIALFLGFTKRRAELYATSEDAPIQRKVLRQYQPVLLDKMIVITATCVILTYSLYTMSPTTIQIHHTDSLIYTVPFVMYGIFRYIFSLHQKAAGADPAQEIFRDPHILFSILGWLLTSLWIMTRH